MMVFGIRKIWTGYGKQDTFINGPFGIEDTHWENISTCSPETTKICIAPDEEYDFFIS